MSEIDFDEPHDSFPNTPVAYGDESIQRLDNMEDMEEPHYSNDNFESQPFYHRNFEEEPNYFKEES